MSLKMSSHLRALPSLALLVSLLGPAVPAARAGLLEYVKKPDASFTWKFKSKTEHPQGLIYDLSLVSQTWQGIAWEHSLQVYLPKNVQPGSTIFLWNQGGKPNVGSMAFGMDLSHRMGIPCAILYGIPNQPLFDGKKEDALIAETFVRYLKTKDESWPLLFPMVKSLVRAMDALQEFSKEELKPVKDFIVSGGSKRGWTTWLTAAADPRVKAIAPLVIDTLNMLEQMPHQLKSFGAYSAMIKDYTERGLVPLPDTAEAKKLWTMIDPYAYRDRLTMPKMIINGGNDPYWTVDALNLYWDDLKGDKWVLIVPNAGHDLQQRIGEGKRDRERVLNGLAAFVRHVVKGTPMPRLEWKHDEADGRLRLKVQSTPAPKAARLWVAHAPTRDFRKATWTEQAATIKEGTVVGEVDFPAKGFLAFYGELDFEIDGIRHQLSTQVRVAEERKPRP
jgi:PhoPQ-activated pathogenicity-related protein